MSSRDQKLMSVAREVLAVYWGSGKVTPKKRSLILQLPVMDGEVAIQIKVRNGVFTISSRMPKLGEQDLQAINRLNQQMEEASFSYLLKGQGLFLQSKLAVPDIGMDSIRPPALRMAWQAGWKAAGGEWGEYSGPSSYDQFVFLADLLAAMILEQWHAQQAAAAIMMDD